jgi:uncharacterized membrane protein SpoIIM required for sporulation
MRLGFAVIHTRGFSRSASVRRAAEEAFPVMGASMVLFALAALIEGFLSPADIPYWIKAATAIVSTLLLLFYVLVLGYPRRARRAV